MSYRLGKAWCLRQCCITRKQHPQHSDSSKEKHLIGAGLQFQRTSSLSSWHKGSWHTGRHGSGEVVADSSTSESAGSGKPQTLGLERAFWNLTHPLVTHFFQQGHNLYSFQIVPLPSGLYAYGGHSHLKHHTWWLEFNSQNHPHSARRKLTAESSVTSKGIHRQAK